MLLTLIISPAPAGFRAQHGRLRICHPAWHLPQSWPPDCLLPRKAMLIMCVASKRKLIFVTGISDAGFAVHTGSARSIIILDGA